MENLDKNTLNSLMSLYENQHWLRHREKKLLYLLLGRDENEKKLLFSLLNRFSFIEGERYNELLSTVADFIVNKSGFIQDKIQIASTVIDSDADSSLQVIQAIKVHLVKLQWTNIEFTNRLGRTNKHLKKGRDQIILMDEFSGTGATIINRFEFIKKNISTNFEFKCCLLAAMKPAFENIQKSGIEIFCPLLLNRGISDNHSSDQINDLMESMLRIENNNLQDKINDHDLVDYSLGYNKAEALFSTEGISGNTPNSVFPIFWWPRDLKSNRRETILNRYERGLS